MCEYLDDIHAIQLKTQRGTRLLHRMALCRELGYEQFITMGHSIGGFWCQQIAAGLPDNCRGAIMFSVRSCSAALLSPDVQY